MVRLPKPKKIKLLNGRIFLAKYKLVIRRIRRRYKKEPGKVDRMVVGFKEVKEMLQEL